MRSAICFAALVLAAVTPVFAESPLAQSITAFQLKDYRGHEVSLADYAESKVVVVAFLGTQCPLAKLYSVRLQEISDEYADKGVVVLGVNSNVQDPVTRIAGFVRQHGIKYPMLKDVGNVVADQFGAERTPEIFVLDADRKVRYRGRVDDQYVIGIVRDKADRHDLKIAVDELLDGKPVSVARTETMGCHIGRIREPNKESTVTYSNQISRIFQQRCVECHRDGEIAPFTLTSYDDVYGWGEMIAEVVKEQRMPPWHALPSEVGHFSNDRSMTKEEKDLIMQWVKDGCPEGDATQLPEPKTYTEGWNLPHEPDVVFNMRDKPFTVPADAGPQGVAYQNFWVDPGFKEDKWISAADVRPGNRAVVHHIIVYGHPEGRGKGPADFLFAYVPGLRLSPLPAGSAKKIAAGSMLRFQVHYTPIGSVQEDLSSVGLIFTNPDEITHVVKTMEVAEHRFELQPNTDDQEVKAESKKSPVPIQLISLSPHMHVRGKTFKYEIELKNGKRKTLLDIPHYDFNWQTQYRFADPIEVPAGARMICTATYDNTAKNLANPDPNKLVTWGDQSWDEMMIGYFDVLLPANEKTLGKLKR
ncbi:MAG: redoxin domain-containing protein [Planctomycetaceae bacterium]|nr:redoxin domain-containing protein [Planctomycetaceae bacterium]MCB9953013.1 redoxin domain-containing protein [Planctomycetaceae bacterium]